MDWTVVIAATIPVMGGIALSTITYYRGRRGSLERWQVSIEAMCMEEREARLDWQDNHMKFAEDSIKETLQWQMAESEARKDSERRGIRGDILDVHNRAVEKGHLGPREWEHCHDLYDRYKSKELNGNSFVDELMAHIDNMKKKEV